MGEPSQPTPSERLEARLLACMVVEAVRNDELIVDALQMDVDVFDALFRLAQEVEILAGDLDAARRLSMAVPRSDR